MEVTAAEHGITLPGDTGVKTSGGAARHDGATIDACSLLTKADADATLGEPTKVSDHEKDDQFSSHCHYVAADETHAANGFGLEIHNDEDANDARNGQAIKKGIYSNVSLYTLEEL